MDEIRETNAARGILQTLEAAHSKNETIKGVTDVEWDIRTREWEKERQAWVKQMVDNSIWVVGSSKGKDQPKEFEHEVEASILLGPRRHFGLDPELLQHDPLTAVASRISIKPLGNYQATVSTTHPHQQQKPGVIRIHKHKKLSRLELLKYISDWDKASYGRRDTIVMNFIRTYKPHENVYDTDAWFSCGGSLIFCRFAISLQMCFLKHRKVWHYFDALSIFVKSLQGDRYSEEFLRLGGLGFVCEVIRVEISGHSDKLHACKFLVELMKGRKSIAVKMFICDNPHFLESLVDSLTMCKDKKLIWYCGLCFENLCIEATIPNVMVVTNYVMRLLPCDFNPLIQSMAFRVLQSVVRLKPSVGAKCVKPILDNLKTEDMDLLVEMSNLSLVILQTKYGPELINQLMSVAEGIQLREQFKSVFKPHMRKVRGMGGKDNTVELRKARQKHERVRQKMRKLDHYLNQAGALFVLNRMMTNKIDFVAEFTKQGIFGLSLKTLGSCPHWEVQGQGVTMVQFLHAMSIDCAVSYFLMLPEKMMILILEKPAVCLRYFTSPICVLLRKLGRFALRLWDRWLNKVVIPAQAVSENGMLPAYFIDMCKMTRKVHEIQNQLAELLEHPVMEGLTRSADSSSGVEEDDDEDWKDFVTDDEDDICQYRSGKEALSEGKRFQPFADFLDFQPNLSDDKLDMKVDVSQQSVLLTAAPSENEQGAYEQILLQEAEKKVKQSANIEATLEGETEAAPVDSPDETGEEKEGV
ncbi:hypothetical protein Ocin01_09527 [Orchesella cincta]|uniref:Uncharacterized protein n=1 Tax=Orchesella cincta TaxID=48709 RepID=A0A1D2MVP0_ORCCI|nr:hypothetical protein Ocin01_09527 [Orchesella cincta]